MAPKSTIFKVILSVSDINRSYYEDHVLTVARHPSETDTRMIVRILAFALNAHERLEFGKGLSTAEEPDLWQTGLTGDIEHWIDLGQPAEKRIRQACSKAHKVSLYSFQKGAAGPWFDGIKDDIERFKHLRVTLLTFEDESLVTAMVGRSMRLSCTIQDEEATLSDDAQSLVVSLNLLKDFAGKHQN